VGGESSVERVEEVIFRRAGGQREEERTESD
jgi:hypothetical protein